VGYDDNWRNAMKLLMLFTALSFVFTLVLFAVVGCSAAETKEPAKLKLQRQKMRQRQRRVMYNDDGCGPSFSAEGATPQGFLYGPTARMSGIIGTQVDSVFICSGATHVLNHPSSVGETYADVVDKYNITEWKAVRDTHRALFDAGTDPIKLTQDFCKKLGVEVFYSYRVNDIHNAYESCKGERSTWMLEHLEYCLFNQAEGEKMPDSDPRRQWSSLDFEIPQVREHLLGILEDVANRYDLDGMEIDYFRSPVFFKPTMEFKPCTKEQLDILTGFQRRVREICLKAGNKLGRPMLVAARVPMTVATCKHVGIDIERWLKEDLLDILPTGGGYVPFTMPTTELVKLGHKHGVPVYPTISASGMRGAAGNYGSVEAWRGAASNAWFYGADGMYLFNHFPNKPSEQFKELGDPVTLAKLDKLFAIDNARISEGDLVQGVEQDQILPKAIPGDGSALNVILPVGDNLKKAESQGILKSAALKVQLSDASAVESTEVTLNGKVITPDPVGDKATGWVVFAPKASTFKQGDNAISVKSTKPTADGKSTCNVTAVELSVDYK
jgi:hypothetical protein